MFFDVLVLLFRREIVLADSAKRADKIVGKIFPFGSSSDSVVGISDGFVVNVTAHVAYVLHNKNLLRGKITESVKFMLSSQKRYNVYAFFGRKPLFFRHFVKNGRDRVEVIDVCKFDKSGVGRTRKSGVERDTRKKGNRVTDRDVFDVAVPENFDFRSARCETPGKITRTLALYVYYSTRTALFLSLLYRILAVFCFVCLLSYLRQNGKIGKSFVSDINCEAYS